MASGEKTDPPRQRGDPLAHGEPTSQGPGPTAGIHIRRARLVARVEITYTATPTTSASARPGRSRVHAEFEADEVSRPADSPGPGQSVKGQR